ncbi:GNAT family N-acetyltransferase [Celeribacter neptunius]|uniref:Ribosomal-protein-alanine N-acetyltransferase n=1 Tax=Celeribacter neptunius TaxID=588602 RepID=A0A1I3QHI3_9RHOB|nr:GNAT family N-acetyltransferase [Celeribacter neptunius]SFJ33488.1 ribosomal-protein-alanine N-acetyltransferase [Celeribacter neptunius]
MPSLSSQLLAEIHAACFETPRPWSAQEFDSLLSMKGVFLVTGEGPSFALGRYVPHECELLTLAVAPEARGRGFGRAMLRAYEKEADRRIALKSFLEVAEDNAVAISLYRAEGYSESGRRKHYYTRPDRSKIDALIFTKRIKHT